MANIDLNIYLHSEEATKKLREFGVDLDKFRQDMKLSNEEQIEMEKKLIDFMDQTDKKRKELSAFIKTQRSPEQYAKEREAISKAKDEYNKLGSAWFDADIELKGLKQTQDQMGKGMEVVGGTVKKSGSIWKVLGGILGKTTVIIGIATTAFKLIKNAIMSNNLLVEKLKIGFAQASSVVKEFGRSLLQGNGGLDGFIKRAKDAAAAAKEFKLAQFDLAAIQNQNKVIMASMSGDMITYRDRMNDETLTVQERTKAANDYYEAEFKIIQLKQNEARKAFDIAIAQLARESSLTIDQKENIEAQTLALIKQGVAIDKNNELWKSLSPEALAAFAAAQAAWEESGNAYIQFEIDKKNTTDSLTKDREQKQKEANAKALARQKEFNDGIKKLMDEYAASQIESLSGLEQIEAQRIFNLKAVTAEEQRLRELGTLTGEHLAMLNGLRDYYNNQAIIQEAEFNKKLAEEKLKALEEEEKNFKDAKTRAYDNQAEINDLEYQLELQGLDLKDEATDKNIAELDARYLQRKITALKARYATETDEELKLILDKEIALAEGAKKAAEKIGEKSKFNFFEAIGVTDPEDVDKVKSLFAETVNNVAFALSEITSARLEEAQKRRSILEDQISDTTAALDREIEIAKLGYANNVDAKRKELEELEKQRAKAIEDEKKAAKAQQAVDTAMQVMSLITATANIFKGFSALPIVGQVLAVAAVASMFAAFAASKVKAAAAAKLSEGGHGDETGVITGKRHSQGGERFIDHIEVEQGERWGVLNRRASSKYGKAFGEIVNSFNRDKLPVMTPSEMGDNNITVDVSQTNERLDRVHYQLLQLNKKFSPRKEVTDTPTMRIEKIGNKTRIIRK